MFNTYAFISYQTKNKHIAGKLKEIFQQYGIKSFLAHEDIHVTEEWRLKILQEIDKADIFIPLICNNYLASPWCIQEAGIAAYRKIPVIPISIDDNAIPMGFINHIQSIKIKPENMSLHKLIPVLIKINFNETISILIDLISQSGSFRGAEANFEIILPYLEMMNKRQIRKLLSESAENDQIYEASKCSGEYIPPILQKYGSLLGKKAFTLLSKKCKEYKKYMRT